MGNSENVNIGNAGEYFVAGELERRGFTVAVPMSNVKDFDILAIDRETHHQVAIQVKSTRYKHKRWTLAKKNEDLIGDNIVYVFVSLNELDTPEYHIVPSKIVAKTIKEEHQKWLDTPGKNGHVKNDTNIRTFFDEKDVYLDKWDLLKLEDVRKPGMYDSVINAYIALNKKFGCEEYSEKQRREEKSYTPEELAPFIFSKEMNTFVEEVYKIVDDYPELCLKDYPLILLKNGIDSGVKVPYADASDFDGQSIMALILSVVRGEKFCDGIIRKNLDNGCLDRWIHRLMEIK